MAKQKLDMREGMGLEEEIIVKTPEGDVRITITARSVGIGLEGHGTRASKDGRMDEIILLDLTGVEFGDPPFLLVWDNINEASWTQRVALVWSKESNRRTKRLGARPKMEAVREKIQDLIGRS